CSICITLRLPTSSTLYPYTTLFRSAGNHVPRARPDAPRERGGDIVPASHPQPAARQRPAHRAAGGGGLALPGRAPAGGATAGTRGGDGVLRDHPPARTPTFACRAKGPGGGARGSGGPVPARGAPGSLIQPPSGRVCVAEGA